MRVIVACGILKNKHGKILMGLRPSKQPFPGFWEFPGGKLENNESITDCLKREWMEELNVNIKIENLVYNNNYKKFSCYFFTGKILDEENIKINVHEKIKYCDIHEIRNLKLFKEDYKILDLL